MHWADLLDRIATWAPATTPGGPPSVRLTADEALVLYEDAPLADLQHAALIRRRQHVPGDHVTYLVDRNVNYTNVCTINCQFCSFYRPPGHQETYTLTTDQISTKLSELEAIGGSRVLMQGGVHPELPLSWYTDLLSTLHARHPEIDLDCFSPIEIEGISEVTGVSIEEVLVALRGSGMHGLPGGGAEMLVDAVRAEVSPKKHGRDAWMNVMRAAQRLGMITSATNVFGFGEPLAARVDHLIYVREHQDAALAEHGNGFTSFIAWPVQLEHNSYGRRRGGRNRVELGAGPIEYLRHVAVSRLVLDNVPHIQASWPTMGLEVAQAALLGGADDIGSTMMEENVVSASGTEKTESTERELQQAVVRAGFRPERRNSRYERLPTEALVAAGSTLAVPPPAQPGAPEQGA